MKNIILFSLTFTFLFPNFLDAYGQSRGEARVSIQEIQNRSASGNGDSCGFYGIWATPGEVVREMLSDEILKVGGVTLVEREVIDNIYEKEMNHENLDQSTVVKKKKFIAATLSIAGVVSEFEWCVSGQGQGIDVGGLLGIGELSVGHQSSKAHVAIDLRLVDVETGKILKTFRSEGSVEDSGFSVGADAFGVRLSKDSLQRTPLGKAVRMAVADAAAKIASEVKNRN